MAKTSLLFSLIVNQVCFCYLYVVIYHGTSNTSYRIAITNIVDKATWFIFGKTISLYFYFLICVSTLQHLLQAMMTLTLSIKDNSVYAKSWFWECGHLNSRKNIPCMHLYLYKNYFAYFLTIFMAMMHSKSLNRAHKTW